MRLTFIKNAKGTPNVIADTDGGKLDAAFKDGKVGYIFNGPWATGDYVKALGADKLGIADPIAVGDRQVRAVPRHQEHLPERQQPEPEAAQAFLKFMSAPRPRR